MANTGYTPFGPMTGDMDALLRQYWNNWNDAMRAAAMGNGIAGALGSPVSPVAGLPDWNQSVDWWSRWLHGERTNADGLVERFNAQARQWFGQMQQVAAQFVGRDASAADIATNWKKALGAAGENPFPEMFRAMRGRGQQGLEQWMEDAAPYVDAWRREASSWLSLPTFGLNRQHQQRLQQLLQAQLDYQQASGAFNALLAKAGQRAFELFESKLGEHEKPGRQLASARALFDLWIDAAEEAYAGIALSPEFRGAYGALVNAQMRLRGDVQRQVEAWCEVFGLPTRTEVDAAHRKIADLERRMRRMRDSPATHSRSDGDQQASSQAAKSTASRDSHPKSASKTVSKATQPMASPSQPLGATTTAKKGTVKKPIPPKKARPAPVRNLVNSPIARKRPARSIASSAARKSSSANAGAAKQTSSASTHRAVRLALPLAMPIVPAPLRDKRRATTARKR